ncbi:MAG TPA: DegQ family serine endoprotease [Gammaproteobacteria bacterium]|nr:DegQ family serine endoprotease [Gammaproteobacteria bacterium]
MSRTLIEPKRWRWPLAGLTAAALVAGAAIELSPEPRAQEALTGQAPADAQASAQAQAPISAQARAPAAAQAGPVSFADVVEKARPAVVNISVTKIEKTAPAEVPEGFRSFQGSPFEQFFGRFFEYPNQPRRMEGAGSGFVIDQDGYIVTNHHVISDADKIVVTFQNGEKLNAKLIGQDTKTDLALLKVDASHKLPFVAFGDSDKARIGDWVLAIGNPFGLGGTATAGIVSARGRDIQSGPYDDYLQIDAPINPGNSGGPVFDVTGHVIGINTAIYSPNGGNIGIGFAIPSDQAASVIAQLRNGGVVERGWLGVQIQNVDDDLAKSLGLDKAEGALVDDVVDDSPASKAGVQTGDVILEVDGGKIDSNRVLSRLVGEHKPGDTVRLRVLRQGNPRDLTVKLGDASTADDGADTSEDSGDAEDGGQALGLTLGPLTSDSRSQLGLPSGVHGVLVVDVDPDGPAADKGIRAGDVIMEVNHRSVASVDAAVAELDKAKQSGSTALLLVRRGDSQYFVAMSFS